MGPARALRDLLACMLAQLEAPGGEGIVDDQHALALCMFERPELVTLDYSSTLVMSLAGLHAATALDAPRSRWRSEKRSERSQDEAGIDRSRQAARRNPCFMHFNGPSRNTLWRTVWRLRNNADRARTLP